MKTTLTFMLLLCTATVFAQSTTSTSKPNTDTDNSKPKIGSKTDIRNPFDTTKIKAKAPAQNLVRENNNYVGETEKNKTNATRTDANIKNKNPEVNNLSEGDDPFGKTKPTKTNNLGEGDDPFGKTKPTKTNNLGEGEDPFGKTKKNNPSKKKNGYANQEVSY
jgi:hypothetical protein